MRKQMTLLLCSLLWLSATIAYAGSNIMKIHDASGLPGENILIEIEVINEDQFVAFQVDIPFPDGFGYVANSFALSLRSNGHLANANVLPGTNVFRALAFSMTNLPFFGNSGVVATLGLTTPATPGTHELVPTGAIIANPNGVQILTGTVNGTITLTTGTTVIPGDANCDGNVNAIDIITLVNYIMGFNPQPFCFENADINGDGSVNAIDVIGTVNIILGGGTFTCGVSIITDIDGNVYNTVLINNQCWMKENLKTIRDAAGSNITRYCYENNAEYCSWYGGLYTWNTVMNGAVSSNGNPSGVQGICPTGWHVPSDAEFTVLTDYLGGQGVAGGKMKSTRTVPDPHPRWDSPNTGATNESNWSGLPGGYRYSNGNFDNIGSYGNWWSSTEYNTHLAWYRNLNYNDGFAGRGYDDKVFGFSVRCLRDN